MCEQVAARFLLELATASLGVGGEEDTDRAKDPQWADEVLAWLKVIVFGSCAYLPHPEEYLALHLESAMEQLMDEEDTHRIRTQ